MASPTPVAAAPRRGRVLLPTIIVLAVIVIGFVIFTSFYTDWLWFDSVGETEVFTVTLITRLALFASFGLTMAVVLAGTLWVAYRFRPAVPPLTQEQAGLERYRMALDPFRVVITLGIAALIGLLAGISASSEWSTFLRWRNATDFGITDPQFGLDIGFYVFTYPFLRFVLGFAISATLLAVGLAVAAHYLYGGLRLQPKGDRMSTAAQVHLSGLIALLLLLKAAAYWLDRYGLMIKSEALVQGFTGMKYADANAVLPALQILTFVALITAALFIVNMLVRNWVIPMIGLGLLVLTSILVGGVYPAIVQQFQVRPSELVREQPYIERNINATRSAYDIADAQIQEYPGTVEPPTETVIDANLGTLENIRLLDPALASPTYNQLQQIRAYYSFNDSLDVDRYALEGGQRGAIVAAREINLAGIPDNQRNWANDHAVYTHGYGFVAAYDNTADNSGQPDFFESDIPPEGLLGIEQPRIYFGELSPTFSIVGAPEGTPPVELDYPDDASPTGQVNNTYTGNGGVAVGGLFNRLLFATKFQDSNILLTDLINEESRILWDRDPLTRVEKIAPWLTLDQDPYPAVVNGRIVWLVDGYTTSNEYPYSSRVSLSEVTSDSITVRTGSSAVAPRDQLNYARNSVKAVVDAYEGTVTLYAWDESDPILQTWMKAFPGVVEERGAMPPEIEAHVRYPQDLFKVQRVVMSRYHVTDPATFYNGTDFWIVPFDPTQSIQQFQPPYYLTLQMPGQVGPAFSLTTTFAPQRRPTLAAFMAVDSAPGDGYGTIRVLQLPSNTTIPGPTQVQNNFESDPEISAELSLLRRGGSEVNLGNLLSLPFNGGLLYVEPVYLRATQDGYPLLRKVLAGYGANVALEDTLDEALAAVFESDPLPTPEPTPGPNPDPNPDPGPTPTPTPTPTPGPSGDPLTDLQTALADAEAAYARGQAALADGDFAAYGQAQADLEAALRRAREAEARLTGDDGGQPA
jgi:uncharacterized membrane protein (UPF0182 family)